MQPRQVPEEGSTSASLEYGILVNVHTLVVAAKTFATFSTDVHSLDLILSRKSRAVPILSSISPPPRASLQSLPTEVLLLVRQQLLDLHLAATPNAYYKAHSTFFDDDHFGVPDLWDWDEGEVDRSECSCPLSAGCTCSEEVKKARERSKQLRNPAEWDEELWTRHDDVGECDICESGIAYGGGVAFHRDGNAGCTRSKCIGCETFTIGQIRRLLRAYGLSLSNPVFVNAESAHQKEYLAAITLPSYVQLPTIPPPVNRNWPHAQSPPRPASVHSHHSPHLQPYVSEHQRATFYDPSFLAVTPEDDKRFARIVRDLRLDVAKPAAGGGASISRSRPLDGTRAQNPDDITSVGKTGTGDEMGEEAASVDTDVKPSFMLLHSVAPWHY
ncbi:hypothetical protein RQP46_008641 [Phenoliferia psychrophenolica]